MYKSLIFLLLLSSFLNAQKIANFTTDKNNQKTYQLSKNWIDLTVDELKELDKEFFNNQIGNLEDGLKYIRSIYKNFDADINEFEFLKKLQIITNEKRNFQNRIEQKFLYLNENCCSKNTSEIATHMFVLHYNSKLEPKNIQKTNNLKTLEEAEKLKKIYSEKYEESLKIIENDKKTFQENLFELYKLLGYEETQEKLTDFQLSGIQQVLFNSEIVSEIFKNKYLNHLTKERKEELKKQLKDLENIEDLKGFINPLTQYLTQQI